MATHSGTSGRKDKDIMSVSFARQTKLNNVVGRSDYISNPSRQEEIVLHSFENMQNSWQEYADFETKNQRSKDTNNQAREIIIPLPHELEKDKEKLKNVVDDYCKSTLGNNRDFEYAVHWNEKKTNLHAHIIFSERERNNEKEPKVYKRDIWINKETGKLAKANSPDAELRFKKGEIQRDRETGEIKYDDKPFTVKDKRFITRSFNEEIKENHMQVMNKHGYDFRMFDPEKEVAQIHVGHEKKRNPETYKNLQEYNEKVKDMNKFLEKTKMKVQEYIEKFKAFFRHDKEPEKLTEKDYKKAIQEKKIDIMKIANALQGANNSIMAFTQKEHELKSMVIEVEKLKYKEFGIFEFKKQRDNTNRIKELESQIANLQNQIKEGVPENETNKGDYNALKDIQNEYEQDLKKLEKGLSGLKRDTNEMAKEVKTDRVNPREQNKTMSMEKIRERAKELEKENKQRKPKQKDRGRSR